MNLRRTAILFAILSFVFLFICALSAPVALTAPRPMADSSSKILTPQQALNLRRIADLHFSPDGTNLAFTVLEPPKGTENPAHIWILNVSTKRARQYTYSGKSENS